MPVRRARAAAGACWRVRERTFDLLGRRAEHAADLDALARSHGGATIWPAPTC
jgi:hypothetical protein